MHAKCPDLFAPTRNNAYKMSQGLSNTTSKCVQVVPKICAFHQKP